MPVDITDHSDFSARRAKFAADKAAAVAAGDDVALARADADWANAQSQMTADMYQRQDAAREREVRIARIRAENPAAPDAIFQGGDLDQMENAAKAVQAVAGQAQQRGGGQWSPPPSGGSGSPGEPDPSQMTPQEREKARVDRMNELMPKAMRLGRWTNAQENGAAINEEVQRLSLQPIVERFQPR